MDSTITRPTSRLRRVLPWLIPPLLVLALYGQVWNHTFVDFDDASYTFHNPIVAQGLSWAASQRAFTDSYSANYHPLTWISHMVDIDVFGLNAGAHALENAALHACNALLVALLMARLFRSARYGIILGAIFASHPKLVEAVAWISQRKTLLSTLFALVTILAYLHALDSGRTRVAFRWYAAALASFCLSLLSKGMYVTMPGILLILEIIEADLGDRSPSHHGGTAFAETYRFSWARLLPLCLRLVPFALLGVLFSILTVWAQSRDGAVQALDRIPLDSRLNTALAGVLSYIRHFLLPLDLSLYYPRPLDWSLAATLGCGTLLASLTALLAWTRRTAGDTPLLGWILFLGMLLPVIGIVQVGDQAAADRYMYGPIWGLLIAAAALVAPIGLRVRAPVLRRSAVAALAAWLLCASVVTAKQVSYWTDSYTLTLASERSVGPIPQLLGIRATILVRARSYPEAVTVCETVLAIDPSQTTVRQNLAVAKAALGEIDEAIELCRENIRRAPAEAASYINLALMLLRSGNVAEAREIARKARSVDRLNPEEERYLRSIEEELSHLAPGAEPR